MTIETKDIIIAAMALVNGGIFGWWLRGAWMLHRDISRRELEKKQAHCLHYEVQKVGDEVWCCNCHKVNP